MALPLTNIWFPDDEARSRVVAALVDIAAIGAGAVATLTIPNGYPPIDRTIPCPVLAIFSAQVGATLVVGGHLGFAIGGQMGATPATMTPDSAGEFLITGARTIDVWQLAAEAGVCIVVYVAKGTGQET